MKFGVQTFTIRKQQKKNIEKAYLPLIVCGIREFEVARISFNQKNAQIIKDLVEKYDIRIVSIQVKPKQVFGNVDEIVAFCKTVGCENVVISMLPFSCILGSEKKFYDFVETLDAQYDIYKAHGITLAYHHHNWEYVTLSNGKMRMDELLDKTKKIRFVHDTYWTTKCGIPSHLQVKRFGKRLLGIHMRDMALYKSGLKVLSRDAAVGCGVVNFEKVLKRAEKAGCEYYVIEQKTKHPYEEIQISYQNCLQMKAKIEE